MAKKALVIGSLGNIGKPLTKYLKSIEYDVLETDFRPLWRKGYFMADINQPLDLIPAFDWKPDYVFMLSSMVSRVTCEQAPGLAVLTNLAGLNNVIQMTKQCKAKLIYFSTSEVYGPNIPWMDEATSIPKPNNRYGLTKLLGERLVEYEVEQYGMGAVILRPFMIYDENEDLGDHRSAMVRFAYNLSHGDPIAVHTGSARGWLHISDAVRAIECSSKLQEFQIVNIGNPDIRPIHELAEMIRSELNADIGLLSYVKIPDRMTMTKSPNLHKQKTLLNCVPNITLEKGVELICKRMLKMVSQGL